MEHNLVLDDAFERQQALDPAQSFIVQAPAGSGKTELLIQRFLTLLSSVKNPEEILAITFTKKAANEMRARVIKSLQYAAGMPEPESTHAKQTWQLAKKVLNRDQQLQWNLIANPNQLRIQTIDSLCSYLTKHLPILSGFGSQPSIADYPLFLYREAVQEVLLHIEENFSWSKAIIYLLLHLDNDLNKLHNLLVDLLAKRDQWLPHILLEENESIIKNKLEDQLALVIIDHLTLLKTNFPKEYITELLNIARFAAGNLAQANIESPLISCLDIEKLPGTKACDKVQWQGLATLLLTKSGTWRKKVDATCGFPALNSFKSAQEKQLHADFRQRLIDLIGKLSLIPHLESQLFELFILPDASYQPGQWEILYSLFQVLKVATAQLKLTFQRHGQIDFIENTQAALLALGNDDHPTDLTLMLDYQIQHILVDEFQDTSSTQYQLLEKLIMGWQQGDGKTLFVVGDPMQSIYRFREAEVGLFMRMREAGIGQILLTPLTLKVNFRSCAPLVEWNNLHFNTIFPALDNISSGAVTYSPSTATGKQENYPAVSIKGFTNTEKTIQAEYIVELIKSLQQVPTEKTAILVRSRSHLLHIIPALKAANIPYHAVNIDSLSDKQMIQDLLSLTCAMLHFSDRISWLAILRAPWCGLTLSDLLVIAGENAYRSIWEQLCTPNVIARLSENGKARINKILPILKNKLADRERENFRTWIESTWLLLGGPACLQHKNDLHDAQAFFTLLSEFGEQHQTLNIDKLKEKIKKLFATVSQEESNLQIMTIHSAKGLEFDHVILPHLESKTPNADKPLFVWMEQPLHHDQIALLLAPINATGKDGDINYKYIQNRLQKKLDYETDRLLYVAATRAKKKLHLYFNITQDNNEFKTESGSFLEKIWPSIKSEKDHIIAPAIPAAKDEKVKMPRYIARLTTDWKNPLNDIASNATLHQKLSGFQLADNTLKIIGTVTHRILQFISMYGVAWWQEKNLSIQLKYIQKHLQQLNMHAKSLQDATSKVHTTLSNALQDERGQWILSAHSEHQSEFAITAIIENNPVQLIVDRTFIDDQATRWIIDYKTTAFSADDMNVFLNQEQEKYLIKMQKYAQAMRLIDNRPIKLGLYFPAIPAWREWNA